MSAADVVAHTLQAFTSGDAKAQTEWSAGILTNANAMELLNSRITHSQAAEVELISRILATRAFQIREEYEVDRPQLWFLDMFRSRGLLFQLQQGVTRFISNITDYQVGEVRFIGDKTDDWPTEGGRNTMPKMTHVKHFGKAVEYGIIELWEAARDGRDIIAQRVRDAFYDIDVFIDTMIVGGAPLHGFHGFLAHPDIPVNTVPASVANPPNTDWPSKTPDEVLLDLQLIRDSTRIASNYTEIADTVILSDMRYAHISARQIGESGDSILSRWVANQQAATNGGLKNIVPFVPYDTAGAGGGPVAVAGNFVAANIEFLIGEGASLSGIAVNACDEGSIQLASLPTSAA
jgi:hypothetical protein